MLLICYSMFMSSNINRCIRNARNDEDISERDNGILGEVDMVNWVSHQGGQSFETMFPVSEDASGQLEIFYLSPNQWTVA